MADSLVRDWMAFNKRNKRKIVVSDQEYYWSATGNDGWIGLRVMAEVQGGQVLSCYFDYHQDHVPMGDGVVALQNQFVVTPHVVRQAILYGLEQGWTPLEKGPELNLRHIDDKVDLRLAQNREDEILRQEKA